MDATALNDIQSGGGTSALVHLDVGGVGFHTTTAAGFCWTSTVWKGMDNAACQCKIIDEDENRIDKWMEGIIP